MDLDQDMLVLLNERHDMKLSSNQEGRIRSIISYFGSGSIAGRFHSVP